MKNNQKIPEGWSVKKGKDIASLITKGASPKWQGFEYCDSGTLFVTSENVRDGFLDISNPKFLPSAFSEKQKRSILKNGDILINIVGASIGRSCLYNRDIPANINQAVCLFRCNSLVHNLYTLLYLSLPKIIRTLLETQTESARPNLSLTDISLLNFLLPPLAEQEKIAEILGTWDEAIEKLSSLIEQKKLLKKGLMQKLLTGKVRLFKTSPLAGEVADLSAGEGLDNQQSESIQNKKITNTLAYRQDCPLTSPLAGEVADLSASEGLDNNDNIKISSHRMYQPYIKEFSRDMRKNSTKAENLLWQKIRNGQLGFKFRRQHQIDNKYIADFICLEKRLIIELDGGQHNDRPKDKDRTLYLENNNFKVIRFWDNEILQNIDGCLEILLKEINLLNNPSPCPSPAMGEGISATYSNSLPQGAMKDVEYSLDTPHLAQECHPLPQGARKDVECSLDTPHLAQECHPLPQGARKNKRFSQPWKEVKLGNFCRTFSGGTPSVNNVSFYDGTIPFIRSGEIHLTSTALFISESGLTNSAAKLVEKGDILFALYGATSGEVDISKINGAINQAILCIKPLSLNKYFLKDILEYKKQNILNKYLQGGQGNLSAEIIKSLKIYIPSDISEQQAIANVLSTADDEIDLLNKKLILFKEQKKGLMQQLLTGNIRVKVN